MVKPVPAQPAEHESGQVTAEYRGKGLPEQLVQTVSPHLLLYKAILVLPTPKAIHEIRLIRLPRQRRHCGTLPPAWTTESSKIEPLKRFRPQNQYPNGGRFNASDTACPWFGSSWVNTSPPLP